MLQTLQLSPGGKLATITLTREMVARTGTHLDLTDGFINFPRSIDGVEVAALLREPPEHEVVGDGPCWRVSFRSRGNVDVAQVAQRFGGGGHKNAAGCLVPGDLEEVRARIAGEIEQELKA